MDTPQLRRLHPPVLLAVMLAAAPAWSRAAELLLPEATAFPPGEAASSGTLDRSLSQLWPANAEAGRVSLVVHKARRRLDLFVDGRWVKSYLINLGLAPQGDKAKRGDNRTPEGEFFVCSRNAKSQFTRFLALSYPSPAHLERAARSHPVSAALERATAEAYRRRDRCPPQGSSLGGAVGIHGSGDWERSPQGYRLVDWTWGCVALRDTDILELFAVVRVGTPVRVLAD